MKMNKQIILAGSLAIAMMFSACSGQPEVEKLPERGQCLIENKVAPSWVCNQDIGYKDQLKDLGIAPYRGSGEFGFARREAMANGRSNLAQQIQTEVKDKVATFMEKTGLGERATIDKVTTQVSKQVARVSMTNSHQLEFWDSGTSLFILVGIPKKDVNSKIGASVRTSLKNDDALWQQYKAKNSLDGLDKEFE